MLSDIFYIVNFSFCILSSLISLVVCSTTILIVVNIRRFRTLNNILLCNTCVAAIFYSIVVIIASIYGCEDWSFNAPVCSFRAYCFNVGVATICHSKSMHAISRLFFAVLYKRRYLLTRRTHWILIILTWIIGITVCLPPFFVNGGYALEQESRSCVISSKMYLLAFYISVVSCIIPFNIIAGVYFLILVYVHRSSRRVWAFNQNTNNTLHTTKREMKLMKQMVVQTGIMISGGPIFLFLVGWHATQQQPPPESLYLLGFTLMTTVASIIPIVQFIMNKQLKNFVIQFFKRYQPINLLKKLIHRQQQAWHIT